MHRLLNVPILHNKNYWTLQPVKVGVQDEADPIKWSQIIYDFIYFPLFLLLRMSQKVPGLTKYTFRQFSLPYQKGISVQSGEILLVISYWKL